MWHGLQKIPKMTDRVAGIGRVMEDSARLSIRDRCRAFDCAPADAFALASVTLHSP